MHVAKYRVQLCGHSGSKVDFHLLFPSIVTNCRGAMYLLHTAVRRTTSCPPKVTLSCNSCKCMRVNGRALQLHAVYKKPFCYYKSPENPYQYCSTHENPYQCYKSHKNPYQVLHVTRTVSGRCNEINGSYDNCYYRSILEKIITICCRWRCYSCCTLIVFSSIGDCI